MLYIFHVDTGTMMTFDMNLALESVSQLKEVVARDIHIPVEKQVLLVSGGESLDPNARVCSYSAGTDTNPIYLFSLASIESSTPPSPSTHSLSGDIADFDPKERVEATRNSPSTLETVTNRSRLAQELCELARLETRACEYLVRDQHSQQQGWAAVVANLEDITTAFRSRAEVFRQSFRHHLDTREESANLLKNFSNDLAILGKITLPSALLQTNVLLDEASNKKEDGAGEAEKLEGKETHQGTLLDWISAKDDSCSLEQVASRCARGLEQFDSTVLESLISNVEQALDATNVPDMKEIKGLEERLFGLEQLMFEAKKIVQDQSDLAQAFIQNQNRAGNLRDPSILPDLCASHMRQLLVMLRNQQQLRDIRRRCTKAKEELSTNLYYRLRWIMYVENGICEVDSKLGIYHEGLKRLQRNLEVVRQVHRAPALYAMAVSEVVRRRTFSEAFLNWAQELSSRLACVLGEEEDKRRTFEQATQGHFLTSLFPNMGEKPPPYATRPPPPFDRDLPKLTSTDVENLRTALPELADSIFEADPSPIHQLFHLGPAFPPHIEQGENIEQEIAKVSGEIEISDDAQPSEKEQVEQQSKVDDGSSKSLPDEQTVQAQSPSQTVVEQGTVAQTRTVSGDQDGGFESETDTEEFEKVGRSPSAEGESEGQGIGTGTVLREGECPGAELDAAEVGGGGSHEGGLGHSKGSPERVASLVGLSDDGPPSSISPLSNHPAQPSHAPHLQSSPSSPEFVSTDFYIDESLPSSPITMPLTPGTAQPSLAALSDWKPAASVAVETSLVESHGGRLNLISLLQENLGSLRAELERLQCERERWRTEVSGALADLRRELMVLRAQVDPSRGVAPEEEDGAGEAVSWWSLKEAMLEVGKGLNTVQQRAAEEALRREEDVKRLEKDLSEKEKRLTNAESDMRRAVKEAEERMRVRFRLVASCTSMERSPSDGSLERGERGEHHSGEAYSSSSPPSTGQLHHVPYVAAAIASAVSEERVRWEASYQVVFNEALRRVLAEKEREKEVLRRLGEDYSQECSRLREIVANLSGDAPSPLPCSSPSSSPLSSPLPPVAPHGSPPSSLGEPVGGEMGARLAPPRRSVSNPVGVEPRMTETMCSSVAVMKESTAPHESAHAQKSAKKLAVDGLIGSTSSLIEQGKISISSCNAGDAVLILWDDDRRQYTILQESSTLYFLHPDCLPLLGLNIDSDGTPQHQYSTAEVVEKEYCQAKKSENRYRVPKGTKFYRVRARPPKGMNPISTIIEVSTGATDLQEQIQLTEGEMPSSGGVIDSGVGEEPSGAQRVLLMVEEKGEEMLAISGGSGEMQSTSGGSGEIGGDVTEEVPFSSQNRDGSPKGEQVVACNPSGNLDKEQSSAGWG